MCAPPLSSSERHLWPISQQSTNQSFSQRPSVQWDKNVFTKAQFFYFSEIGLASVSPPKFSNYLYKNVPADSGEYPVEDLQERYDAEAKTQAKKSPKGSNKVDRTHSDPSLKLCEYITHISKVHQRIFSLTHDCALSKEDVDHSNILLPSIVELLLELNALIVCSSKLTLPGTR